MPPRHPRKPSGPTEAVQPGLFDFMDLPDPTPSISQKTDSAAPKVHPSIEDFVVRTRIQARKEMEQKSRAEAEPIEPMTTVRRDDPLLLISFGSGSSGNCAYLGTRREGLLIDAGIDPLMVERHLKDNGLSMANIKGVLLTHDHSDHVRYVYKIVRLRKDVGIYCTPKTLTGLLRRHSISRRVKDYHRPIYKEFPFTVAGLTITAFDVSHDGTDNCGFYLEAPSGLTFAVATDIGSVTERVDFYMSKARYVMLEANYDADMLRTGPYTAFLKSRIAAPSGHLDNMDSGAFAVRLAGAGHLSHIFLCHLSAENNTPAIALSTVRAHLEGAGYGPVGDASGSLEASACRIQLMALPRTAPSRLFVFRNHQGGSNGTPQ